MDKILVVFTGGTIGSKKDSNYIIDIDESTTYLLLELYGKSLSKRDVLFDTLHPLNILSEDLVIDDWGIIKETIEKVDFNNYSGIIITHGSDTLPYSSAAISYMFSNTPIPIILTASNYPLDDNRSNGLRNFISSVDFILDNNLPGVFVVFENHNNELTVHLGTRLMQAVQYNFMFGNFDFESFEHISFGKIVEGAFLRNDSMINPEIEELRLSRQGIELDKVKLSSDIIVITPEPGLNYKYYDFSKVKPKAILHNLYHSGTACMRDMGKHEYSAIEFANYCKEKGIDMYMTPIIDISKDHYPSSHILVEHGVTPLANISVEAAIVKLMMAYGSYENKNEMHAFLNRNLFFENYDQVYLEHIRKLSRA